MSVVRPEELRGAERRALELVMRLLRARFEPAEGSRATGRAG